MSKFLFLVAVLSCTAGLAVEPQIVMTYKNSTGGFGTVAGKVIGAATTAIGITVQNGALKYSTVADPSGSWGIVFRHLATNFTVTAWDSASPNDVLAERQEALSGPH